jgi:hypothetical protein
MGMFCFTTSPEEEHDETKTQAPSAARSPSCLCVDRSSAASPGRWYRIRHSWIAKDTEPIRLDGAPTPIPRLFSTSRRNLGVRRGYCLGARFADPARSVWDRLYYDGSCILSLDRDEKSFCEPDRGAYEMASAYLCIAIILLVLGPGKISLDNKIFGERKT